MHGIKAIFDIADIVVAGYQHRLGCFIARTPLWANVIGRRKVQLFPIPECGMVTCMIIGIAAKNIKTRGVRRVLLA